MQAQNHGEYERKRVRNRLRPCDSVHADESIQYENGRNVDESLPAQGKNKSRCRRTDCLNRVHQHVVHAEEPRGAQHNQRERHAVVEGLMVGKEHGDQRTDEQRAQGGDRRAQNKADDERTFEYAAEALSVF